MKRCPQCGQTKPWSEFNKARSRKDGHQSVCRDCQNTRNLLDYHFKPGRKEAVAATRTRISAEKIAEWYRGLKDNQPCIDCGIPHPWYVMQYDHTGSDKEIDISRAIRAGWSQKRIETEIAKCELVCANCHAVRTFKRRARVTIPPSLGLEAS